MSKISEAISAVESELNSIPQEAKDKLTAQAVLESDAEAMQLQQLQALSFATGLIDEEVAMYIYNALGGELPRKNAFNSLPLAHRLIIIRVLTECAKKIQEAVSV